MMKVNEIMLGSFWDLAPSIPSNSVDMIFTDPVYANIQDYINLAMVAGRVLKPGGSLLCYCSNRNMFDVKAAMEEELRFNLPFYYVVPAKSSRLIGYNSFVWTTPCLWFSRGEGKPIRRTIDTLISHSRPEGGFKWNKNPEAYMRWIADFTNPGEVILDPFAGSGSCPVACKRLGREFLASEVSPPTWRIAQERIEKTTRGFSVWEEPEQKPLFEMPI